MDVVFRFGEIEVPAQLNDTHTAALVSAILPVKSKVNVWGDEIYFEIPTKLAPEAATLELSVGDIGYWPEGSCVCLFFGRTPASINDRPRPASEVNLIGRFDVSADTLRQVPEGASVKVRRA